MSVDRLRQGSVGTATIDDLQQSVMQLTISPKEKVAHNLHPDYPATYFQPHVVAGFFMEYGYDFPIFDCYDLTGREEPTSILMVFHRKK